MLRELHLRDFQKHKNQKIVFDKITTIVGPNESGKSTFLRALYWICFNKPSGKKFIRWGSKRAGVRLLIDDHTIERIRSEKNIYKLDGKVLKAFGPNVPESIKKILNIEQENVQYQIDTQVHKSCFWLTLSPAQVSRELNQIIDLSLLDNVMSFLLKGHRRTKAKLGVLQERLKQAREQKKELACVRQMDRDLISIEIADKELLENETSSIQLRQMLKEIKQQKEEIKKHFSEKGQEQFQVITEMAVRLESTKSQIDELDSLLLNVEGTTQDQEQCKKQLRQTKEKLKKEMVGRCPVCKRKLQSHTVQ